MQPSPHPHGYSPASFVRDYTHRVGLRDGEDLIFNLLTGLGWRGRTTEEALARAAVEQHHGDRLARPVLEHMEAEYRKLAHPVSFQLIPTYGCNFSCAYCYEGSLTTEQRQWTDADIAGVVTACERLVQQAGTPFAESRFTVLGGEVIREQTFAGVEKLVAALARAGARHFEAITNGFELAEHAPRLKDLGIDTVQVTVDGPQRIHDKRRPVRLLKTSSFERILEGVDRCLELGIHINLRINIDQRNIPHLGRLIASFDERGWLDHPRFHGYLAPLERDFSGKMHFVGEDEMARMLVEVAKQEPLLLRFRWALHGLDYLYALGRGVTPKVHMRYCGATSGDYMLDARNGVYACWFGAGQEEFKIAEITAVAAGAPLQAEGKRRLEQWRGRGITAIEPCGTCKWALVCGGGCTFKAVTKTGQVMSPNCAPFEGIYAAAGQLIYEFAEAERTRTALAGPSRAASGPRPAEAP